MNNLSKILMTIAIAGSLIVGGAMSSQAAGGFSIGTDTHDETSRFIQTTDEFSLVDELDIPGEKSELCSTTGKILNLSSPSAGWIMVWLKGLPTTGGEVTKFFIRMDEFLHPIQANLIEKAYLHQLTVNMQSYDGPCEQTGVKSYNGGEMGRITFKQTLIE